MQLRERLEVDNVAGHSRKLRLRIWIQVLPTVLAVSCYSPLFPCFLPQRPHRVARVAAESGEVRW
jgi:hypothetical protein